MRYGKIICDPTSEEAKALLGKKVLASDCYVGLQKVDSKLCKEGILERIAEDNDCPFRFGIDLFQTYTFIREVIEEKPKYVPYDLSKPEVRDKLRGRWYRKKECNHEYCVTDFQTTMDNGWIVDFKTAFDFLEECEWLDGTPCGEEVTE